MAFLTMEVAICMTVIANICLSAHALDLMVHFGCQLAPGLASALANVCLYAQQGCGGMILSAMELMLGLIS